MKITRCYIIIPFMVLFVSTAWGDTATVPSFSVSTVSCQQINITTGSIPVSDGTSLFLEYSYNSSSGSYSILTSLFSSGDKYSHLRLQETRSYCYRIKGIKGSDTRYSPVSCATTSSIAPVTPRTPTLSLVDTNISLSWTYPNDRCKKKDGFQILRWRDGRYQDVFGTGASNYLDTAVNEGSYSYQVRAYLNATYSSPAIYTAWTSVVSKNVVNLNVFSGGGGTVTGTNINCSGNCNIRKLVEKGKSITLTATPLAGQGFDGWSVTGGGSCSNQIYTCTLPMNSSTTITASFVANVVNLNVVSVGSGSVTGGGINCPGSCNIQTIPIMYKNISANTFIYPPVQAHPR